MSNPAFDWSQYEGSAPAAQAAPAFDWGQYETGPFLTSPTESFLKPYQPPTTPKEQARRTVRSAANYGLGAYAPLAFGKFGYNLIANELQRHGVNLPTVEEFIENMTGLPLASEQANQIEQLLPIFSGGTPRTPAPGQPKLPQLPGPQQINVQGRVVAPGAPPPSGAAPSAPLPSAGVAPSPIAPGQTIPQAAPQEALQRQVAQQLGPEVGGVPFGVQTQRPPTPETPRVTPVKPLRGKTVTVAPTPLGDVISNIKWDSDYSMGRELENVSKQESKKEHEPIPGAYAKAKEVTKSADYTYPMVAEKNDAIIEELESLPARNSGQDLILKWATNVRNLVGDKDALREASVHDVMELANSMSALNNYEMPYEGYKGRLRTMVHDLNTDAINALKALGKDYRAVQWADQAYATWASKWLNDEIAPFLVRTIKEPEDLAKKVLANPGIYRAIKNGIVKNHPKTMKKLNRAIVEAKLDKYYKDPKLAQGTDFTKDLIDLEKIVGKDEVAKAKGFLNKRKVLKGRKAAHEKIIEETPAPKKQLKREEREKGPKGKMKEIAERPYQTPEDIDKAFSSVSEIRKFRVAMKSRGLMKEFNELKSDKVFKIFRKGKYGEKEITGNDIVHEIDQNHEVLNELIGIKELSKLYADGRRAGENEVVMDIIFDSLGHFVGKVIGQKAAKQVFTKGKKLKGVVEFIRNQPPFP